MGRASHDRTGEKPLLRRLGRATRARIIAAVLLALAVRSLIPLGFMPAADGSLSLMICPAGFPLALAPGAGHMSMPGGMAMPQDQHHGTAATDEGYCVFTSGFSAAPPPPVLATLFLLLAVVATASVMASTQAGIRLVHLPQARAPPVRI